MKCPILLPLLCLVHSVIFSQNSLVSIEDADIKKTLNLKKIPDVTIQLLNAPDSLDKVDVSYTLVPFGAEFQTSHHRQIDKRRLIVIRPASNLPYQEIFLSVGNIFYDVITVSDDLKITIDLKMVKARANLLSSGVEIIGKDKDLNIVLNKWNSFDIKRKRKLFEDLKALTKSLKNNQTVDQFRKTDSVYRLILQVADNFCLQYPKYRDLIHNDITSEYYGNIATDFWYSKIPDSLFNVIANHKPLLLGNNGMFFYRYLSNYSSSLDFDKNYSYALKQLKKDKNLYAENKGMIDSAIYYDDLPNDKKVEKSNEIDEFNNKLYKKIGNRIQVLRTISNLESINSRFKNPKADVLKLVIFPMGVGNLLELQKVVLKDIKTPWCRKILTNEIVKTEAINQLIIPKSSTKDTSNTIGKYLLTTPSGAKLYQLDKIKNIDALIHAFRKITENRPVIFDFWATWCIPCIQDMPYSQKLHDDNKDLGIDFIYLCTDNNSSMKTWVNRIKNLELSGIHVYVKDEIIIQLKERFNAQAGYPAFTVIDKNGKVSSNKIQRMVFLDRQKLKDLTGL